MNDRRQYVFAVAGCNDPVSGLPRVVDVTAVPSSAWPLWHAAFELDTLVGLWWYAPAVDAVPVLEAAAARMLEPAVAALLPTSDRRGARGHRLALLRLVKALNRYGDNVIAVGVEAVPGRVWVPVEVPFDYSTALG